MTKIRGRQRRSGFTLVEAVVGLVLLAAFTSSTFVAFRVHNAQLRDAADILTATEAADVQLEQLLATNAPPQGVMTGVVAGHPTWRWRLTPQRRQTLVTTQANVSRFEIVRMAPDPLVLVSIDVVTHADPPQLRRPGR